MKHYIYYHREFELPAPELEPEPVRPSAGESAGEPAGGELELPEEPLPPSAAEPELPEEPLPPLPPEPPEFPPPPSAAEPELPEEPLPPSAAESPGLIGDEVTELHRTHF